MQQGMPSLAVLRCKMLQPVGSFCSRRSAVAQLEIHLHATDLVPKLIKTVMAEVADLLISCSGVRRVPTPTNDTLAERCLS